VTNHTLDIRTYLSEPTTAAHGQSIGIRCPKGSSDRANGSSDRAMQHLDTALLRDEALGALASNERPSVAELPDFTKRLSPRWVLMRNSRSENGTQLMQLR